MKKLAMALLVSAAPLLPMTAQAADLTIWGLQAFNQQADDLITEMAEEFGKERGIDVEYVVVPGNSMTERLAAALQAGAPPDVFMQVGPQAQYYASLGVTMPLDDILATMRAVPGGIYESTVSQVMYDGKAHALPLEVDIVPMFARTDLLKDVGLEVPKTLEELRTASQAILKANPGITAFGMTLSSANDAESFARMIVLSYGGEMFDTTGKTITWNSPETVAAYQYIADMFAEGTIPRSTLTWDDAGNNTAYQTGRTAFTINPPSIYQWMTQNDPDLLADTAMIAIPKGPGEKGRSANLISSFSWLVSKDTKRPDDAKAWLNHFFEPERYETIIETVGGRWLPIYPAQTQSMPLFKDTPAFANFDEMARNGLVDGHAGPPSATAAAIFNAKIVTQSLQRMLVDGESADKAVAWAQAEMERLAAAQ